MCKRATDCESVPHTHDNCPDTPNPDQTDSNGNGVGDACDGLVDGSVALVQVPDPLSGDNPAYRTTSVPVPAPGQAITDPVFGTTQTRVTQTEGMRHDYSRHDPFNHDQSLILLRSTAGEWIVCRTQSTPYDRDANRVGTFAFSEPRWDPDHSDVIWDLRDFSIINVNVQTEQETTIKDFSQDAVIGPIITANPDLYRITMHCRIF